LKKTTTLYNYDSKRFQKIPKDSKILKSADFGGDFDLVNERISIFQSNVMDKNQKEVEMDIFIQPL